MKTKKDYVQGILTGTTYYTKGSRDQHEAILTKALQEYSDQEKEEYKAKLKGMIDDKMKTLLSPERYQGMQIAKDIIDSDL